MEILTRLAGLDDVPAMFWLREANAARHIRLGPAGHRYPDTEAVRENPEERFSSASGLGPRAVKPSKRIGALDEAGLRS
jgi:hypothetical protein